jgi:hypothetical protein
MIVPGLPSFREFHLLKARRFWYGDGPRNDVVLLLVLYHTRKRVSRRLRRTDQLCLVSMEGRFQEPSDSIC